MAKIQVSKLLIIAGRALLFLFLTVLTQVGGLVYLINFSTYRFIDKRIVNNWLRRLCKLGAFLLIYLLTTFLIVPLLARPLGRVQLPLHTTNNLRPLTFLTCLLNRNYVRKDLRDAAFSVAGEMNKMYPGTVVNYLDANFPFINRFPLIPHLSHNDGKNSIWRFVIRTKKR